MSRAKKSTTPSPPLGERAGVRGTLTARVRESAKYLGKFTARELAYQADVRTRAQKRAVSGVISEFLKRGEIIRVCKGTYKYQGRDKRRTLMDKIWHLVRSHRHFSTDDIERLSGAARKTVTEYLRCLAGYGYLTRSGRSRWRLVKDPGPKTPVNTAKCKRLKEIRKNKNGQIQSQK